MGLVFCSKYSVYVSSMGVHMHAQSSINFAFSIQKIHAQH